MGSNLASKLLLIVALMLFGGAQAASAYLYRVTVLLPFKPGQGSGVATLINNNGLICGQQDIYPQAFCYYRGTITGLLPLAGDQYSAASGLNDLGQVVGWSYSDNGPIHAVIFVHGVAQALAVTSHAGSSASDINNLGQIVGSLSDVPGESAAYASWLGSIRMLGTLGGPRRIDGATAINDRGQIAGAVSKPGTQYEFGDTVAFLYEKGIMRALSTPVDYTSTAVKINLFGQVIGWTQGRNGFEERRPVLWDKGVRKILLDQPGDAMDINILGQVVGGVYNRDGGFLYHPATGARDLNTLIDPASGYTVVYPQAINDRQQIVGYGCKELLCGPILLDLVGAHAGAERAPVMSRGER